MKTPEHIVPAYNLPKATQSTEAAEAAQSTEAAEAAQSPAEAAEAAEWEATEAAGGRMVCREIPGGRKAQNPSIKVGERTVKKLLFAAGLLAAATSTAWAQI